MVCAGGYSPQVLHAAVVAWSCMAAWLGIMCYQVDALTHAALEGFRSDDACELVMKRGAVSYGPLLPSRATQLHRPNPSLQLAWMPRVKPALAAPVCRFIENAMMSFKRALGSVSNTFTSLFKEYAPYTLCCSDACPGIVVLS